MSSAIETVLAEVKTDKQNQARQPVPAKPPPLPAGSFWREFVRVQSDKFILLGLILLLHFWHAPDTIQSAAVGGLIVLIQGQRFKLS